MKDIIKISEYHDEMESYRWVDEIPTLNFKEGWNVKITPGFIGAIIRFRIEHLGNFISVYLDGYDLLGMYGSPYWELYSDGETWRYDMADTKGLMKQIEIQLSRIPKLKEI